MKKQRKHGRWVVGLTVFLSLLVFMTGAVGVIGAILWGVQDDITFTETKAYGDIRVADGLRVDLKTVADGYLQWHTRFTFGEPADVQTEFSYVNEPISNTNDGIPRLMLNDRLWNYLHYTDGRINAEWADMEAEGDLIRVLPLSDFAVTMPFELSCSYVAFGDIAPEIQSALKAALAVPVESEWTVRLERRRAPDMPDHYMEDISIPRLHAVSATTDAAFYICIQGTDHDGQSLPSEHFRIYRIPRKTAFSTINEVYTDKTEAVWSLPKGMRVVSLYPDEHGEQIFFVAETNGTYELRVADMHADESQLLYTFPPEKLNGAEPEVGMSIHETQAILRVRQHLLMVFLRGADGKLSVQSKSFYRNGEELADQQSDDWVFETEEQDVAYMSDSDRLVMVARGLTTEAGFSILVCKDGMPVYRAVYVTDFDSATRGGSSLEPFVQWAERKKQDW